MSRGWLTTTTILDLSTTVGSFDTRTCVESTPTAGRASGGHVRIERRNRFRIAAVASWYYFARVWAGGGVSDQEIVYFQYLGMFVTISPCKCFGYYWNVEVEKRMQCKSGAVQRNYHHAFGCERVWDRNSPPSAHRWIAASHHVDPSRPFHQFGNILFLLLSSLLFKKVFRVLFFSVYP